MEKLLSLAVNLQAFADGGSAPASDGGSAAPQNSDASNQTVNYGNSAEGNEPNPMEEFEALIGKEGKYKDCYTQKTQAMINERFKAEKSAQKQLESLTKASNEQNALLTEIMGRFNVSDPSKLLDAIDRDTDYWEKQADAEGMTVEQVKQLRQLEQDSRNLAMIRENQVRENAMRQQYDSWISEAEKVKETYPDFDLKAEAENPRFTDLLARGLEMETAYQVVHFSEMMASATKQGESKVAASIQANGTRPLEAGASRQASTIVKNDVSKLTRDDRKEIARRVARGEMISF